MDAFLLSDEGSGSHREAQTFVEGGEEEAGAPESAVDGSYNDKIRQLFQYYENHGDDLKARDEGGRLNEYSPKFLKMLQNITNPDNKGLNLIYSQFRSLEGIGMMSLVLNANGFAQFKIKKIKTVKDGLWTLRQKTRKSPCMRFIQERKILMKRKLLETYSTAISHLLRKT